MNQMANAWNNAQQETETPKEETRMETIHINTDKFRARVVGALIPAIQSNSIEVNEEGKPIVRISSKGDTIVTKEDYRLAMAVIRELGDMAKDEVVRSPENVKRVTELFS